MQKNIKNIVIVGIVALILGVAVYFLTTRVYKSCLVRPSDLLVNEETEM